MAKKKVSQTQKENPLSKQEDIVKAHQEVSPSMDSEASEKFENLKSLNQMLLKKESERRQQIDSLVQSKGFLEMELTRSNAEKEALRVELNRLGEIAAGLELEGTVVAVFVGVELGFKGEAIEREMSEFKRAIDEMESEIGRLNGKLREIEGELGSEREVSTRVGLERDEIKDNLNLQLKEDKVLRANLIEFEERKRVIERELGELRAEYDVVVGEKGEMEMMIDSITREKDSMENSLMESRKLIEVMKEEVCGVVKEKQKMEEEKYVEMGRRKELESAVSGLNEMVFNLKNEELKLRSAVAELEKKFFVGEERQKEMGREIEQLVEENKLSGKKIEGLAGDKAAIERDLSEAVKQFAEEKRKIEVMVNENIAILETKSRLESEVGALQKQVAELKSVISKLEKSSQVEVEKIKGLESEVGDYRCNLEQVKIERDGLKNYLDEEKQNAVRLEEKIGSLESKIEENLKVSEKVKAENAALFAEKVELESQCELLKKEITTLENTVTEVWKELDLMKGKVEIADTYSDVVLTMLKGTAAFCSEEESDAGASDLLGNGEETKAYVVELELIKNAFKNKASKIDTMKKQLELLQSSVEDAHKKKSFWTALSSATTLLAAVSIAYVARGH